MNFATWSIRNPVPTILLFALLSFAGLYGFSRLPIQNFPDIDLPMVSVTLALPGAAPAQLETEVARRVEDSLANLQGLRHLRTTITTGRVNINVEFQLNKNLSDAVTETKNAVDQARGDLPNDVMPPVITAQQIQGGPTAGYAVSSTRLDEEALSWHVDDTIARAILAVPGVGRVERIGGLQREVTVQIDPVRMAGLGITAAQVSRALRQVQQESSGGRAQIGGGEQAVRTIALARRAEELSALPIVLPNGKSVRLDEVATISDGTGERTQAARLNGKPSVGFRVYRSRGFDEVAMSRGVKAAVEQLTAADPTLTAVKVFDNTEFTLAQYEGSLELLFEGAILAVLVVWLFLRDWRATLISATALPLSILPAFAAMQWLGYSLNTITLLALAVIVGILVDDAIVEIENVERHINQGKPVKEATIDAVNEIALAVIATTMTLVVVFLPTAVMSGVPGLIFQQFGWTVVIAVLASLLVARMFTPMLAARFLKPKHKPEDTTGPIMRRYIRAVDWCLTHRKTTLAGTLAFFIGSVSLVPFIPSGFIPQGDAGMTNIRMELPPGSNLDRTLETAEQVRAVLAAFPAVKDTFTVIGAGTFGNGPGEVRRGNMLVVMAPRGERPVQKEVEREIRRALQQVPGAKFDVGFGGQGEKMQLTLTSADRNALVASTRALERELRALGLSNVNSSLNLERPEIVVRPNPQLAAERGVTAAAIGETLRIATAGDFDPQVAKLNLDTRQVYIRVRMPDEARTDLNTIANLRVPGRNGLVPLSSVADITLENGPIQIDRYDRSRYVNVSADLNGMALGEALDKAMNSTAIKTLPDGVHTIRTGDAEFVTELFRGFNIALLTGFVCIFCVLVLLFRDFLQPVTILSAIPLCAGGAFLALLIGRIELSLPAMIGLVTLMGIVTKNSILLVDYAVMGVKDHGLSVHAALMEACRKRARPIVMTTVAMIAGMIPIALGLGEDSSFRQPMAVAVIGGLITSTALSLLIVPVVFVYIDRFEAWMGRMRRRKSSPAPAPAE
ncbi:MAG: efflux RND transporter permease subunit [Rhodospirillaceae bacterium]